MTLRYSTFPTIIGWWPGATVEYLKKHACVPSFLILNCVSGVGNLKFLEVNGFQTIYDDKLYGGKLGIPKVSLHGLTRTEGTTVPA